MLAITQALVDNLHHFDRTGKPPALASSYVNTILKCGSEEDANALLPVFLEKPSDYKRNSLLTILARFGTDAVAQQLFESCFDSNGLKPGMPEALLQTMGQLQYQPAADIVRSYALIEKNDYYASMYGVLGLLHFSCEGHEQQIEEAIRNTFGKNIFNEFVPSLVCKLPNRKDLLPSLYEHGSSTCSTDCNAGILLGLALSGKEGAAYFRQAIFNPDWEVSATGTGSCYWASVGMAYAGVSFQELYTGIQQENDEERLAYQLMVLEGLLHSRLGRVVDTLSISISKKQESLASIFELLFGWETPNKQNNILDLAKKVNQESAFYDLEKSLEAKVEEELLLRCLKCH